MVLDQQQIFAINRPVIKYRLKIFSTNEPPNTRIMMWKYYENLLVKRKNILNRLKQLDRENFLFLSPQFQREPPFTFK